MTTKTTQPPKDHITETCRTQVREIVRAYEVYAASRDWAEEDDNQHQVTADSAELNFQNVDRDISEFSFRREMTKSQTPEFELRRIAHINANGDDDSASWSTTGLWMSEHMLVKVMHYLPAYCDDESDAKLRVRVITGDKERLLAELREETEFALSDIASQIKESAGATALTVDYLLKSLTSKELTEMPPEALGLLREALATTSKAIDALEPASPQAKPGARPARMRP